MKPKRNAAVEKPYRGWDLRVETTGFGKYLVSAIRIEPGLLSPERFFIDEVDSPSEAFALGRKWVDRHSGVMGTARSIFGRRKDIGRYRRNQTARREYIDDLTGTRVTGTVKGGTPTGRKVVRVRSERGQPIESVPAAPDTLDPRRDTFGLDPLSAAFYRREAADKAKARRKRRKKPMERTKQLRLGDVGATTTFSTPRKAAEHFMENNAHLFEHQLFEDVDVHDTTRDFMDRLEVAVGRPAKTKRRKYSKLHQTKRGQQILGKRSGDAIAKEMIVYLMGRAGSKRRWRDVPWGMVDEYVDEIHKRMEAEGSRRGLVPPASGIAWYPLSSGVYSTDEVIRIAAERLGKDKAQRLADWLNSQELYDMATAFDRLLKPPKGPAGTEGRKVLKCIPAEDRRILRHRARTIRQWARYPEEIPDWACVPGVQAATSGVSVCEFPALREDYERVVKACDEPYDPSWPKQLRIDMWREDKLSEDEQFGSGIAPIEYDPSLMPAPVEEELDLPREAAANPYRKEGAGSPQGGSERWTVDVQREDRVVSYTVVAPGGLTEADILRFVRDAYGLQPLRAARGDRKALKRRLMR